MEPEQIEDLVERAATGAAEELKLLTHSPREEVLFALIENPNFGENEALLLLNRRNLPQPVVQALTARKSLINNYSVKLALLKNPKTPASLALRHLKFLYPFDLLSLCLIPSVPPEVKRQAEESILNQLPKLAIGQRLTMARRATPRIVSLLLKTSDPRIIRAGLDNPLITETTLLEALNRPQVSPQLVDRVVAHPKWVARLEIRRALLRQEHLPLGQALALLSGVSATELIALSKDPKVSAELRQYAQRLWGAQAGGSNHPFE